MSLVTILLIALGLAMDAFAVSITSGLSIHRLHINHALRIAFFFGLFQAVMPVIGWLAGLTLANLIQSVDHWIAFTLLAFIGGKMIYESTMMDGDEEKVRYTHSVYVLLTLSVATSIDALAVGLSLSFLRVEIVEPALIIGAVTFVLSFAGVYIGDHFGHLFEKKIEIFGGLVLVAIGTKILVSHLMA